MNKILEYLGGIETGVSNVTTAYVVEILEYLGGIETTGILLAAQAQKKILEYLGGIETNLFQNKTSRNPFDFRIPRRD